MWNFLYHDEDIKWLKDTHLKNLSETEKAEIKSAAIEGNEDCPSKIICYSTLLPDVDETPLFIINPIW